MKNFKNLIREAHLGNPLNEEDSDGSLYDRRQKAIDAVFGQDEEYPEFDINDVRADLEAEMNEGYDDEDIVIYDGEEHVIMRRDGNMIYIRPLEDSAILGKKDEIKVPARALAYKSDLDKMYDEYKPKDEVNEEFSPTEEKMINQIKSYKERGSAMVNLPSKVRDFYFKNKEKIDTLNEDMNDPVLIKARAAQMADEKAIARQAALDKKYGPTFMDKLDAELDLKAELQDLKDEREQLMIDMEQEAEPEGGEIADEYGSRLNDIDARMAEIKPELEDLRMYESVNEDLEVDITTDPDNEELKIKIPGTFDDNDGEPAVEKELKKQKKSFKSFTVKDIKEVPKMEEGNGGAEQDDAQLSLNVSSDAALDNEVNRMGYNESLKKSLKEALSKRLSKK